MAKSKKSLIKESLLNQLADNGIYGDQYTDLVDDYMSLWDLKNKLIKDIRKRGVMIEWKNGQHQSSVKKNDAVSELPKVNRQMLSLLKELGLRPTARYNDDDIEEL